MKNGTNSSQNLHPPSRTTFCQYFLFIVVSLAHDYNAPSTITLLSKTESILLQDLWNLFSVRRGGTSTAAENAAAFHRLSLIRYVFELAGGPKDVHQHRLDPTYTADDNAKIFGYMNGNTEPKRFGTFDSQAILNALSSSPVFPDDTIRELDVNKLSAEVARHLPIGVPDGHFVCYSI